MGGKMWGEILPASMNFLILFVFYSYVLYLQKIMMILFFKKKKKTHKAIRLVGSMLELACS